MQQKHENEDRTNFPWFSLVKFNVILVFAESYMASNLQNHLPQ